MCLQKENCIRNVACNLSVSVCGGHECSTVGDQVWEVIYDTTNFKLTVLPNLLVFGLKK